MIIKLETILAFTCGFFLGTTVALGSIYIINNCKKKNEKNRVEYETVNNVYQATYM